MMSRSCSILALGILIVSAHADVTPQVVRADFDQWSTFGATNLFQAEPARATVNWNSAQPNSYLYLPIGAKLTRDDDFKLTFVVQVDSLQLGSTPGKPYTFQIGAGLINLGNATDSEFFRGAGINPAHGPRNIIEFDYFPASGFIAATFAPTISTDENQLLFSDNHPLELELGVLYKIEMAFSAADQTLRSRYWKGAENFSGPGSELKSLVLSANYSDFNVDTIAIMNYNDEGQNPPQFSGSIEGTGTFEQMELTIYNRPAIAIKGTADGVEITFETAPNWKYQLQGSNEGADWNPVGNSIDGTGQPVIVQVPSSGTPIQFFRVQAERL